MVPQNCTLSCSVCFFLLFFCCRPHTQPRVSEKQKKSLPLVILQSTQSTPFIPTPAAGISHPLMRFAQFCGVRVDNNDSDLSYHASHVLVTFRSEVKTVTNVGSCLRVLVTVAGETLFFPFLSRSMYEIKRAGG